MRCAERPRPRPHARGGHARGGARAWPDRAAPRAEAARALLKRGLCISGALTLNALCARSAASQITLTPELNGLVVAVGPMQATNSL